MATQTEPVVGQTKDVGFQIGVRRTLPVNCDEVWRLLTSKKGLQIWLGKGANIEWTKGKAYRLADGTLGEIRVFSPNSHLRITWQPADWPRPSTIQVRVLASKERTTVSFHQEHLPGANAREERRAHFAAAIDELERIISQSGA